MLRSVRRPRLCRFASRLWQTVASLRRSLPEPERMFLSVGADPERDDETVVADVHAIEDQPDQIQVVQGRRPPSLELRCLLCHESSADTALAGSAACGLRGQRFQASGVLPGGYADQHLLDGAPIQRVAVGERAEGRQLDFAAFGPDSWPAHGDLASAEHDFARNRAGARGDAGGLMGISRSTDRSAILFQHRVEHLQTGPDRQLEELRARVDEQVDQREVALR